jgi:type VI secretion system secreted protein Hcp
MSDLLVASFQTGGSSHGDVVPTEQISLNFAKIEFEYKEQKADGSLGGAVTMSHDLKKMVTT